MPNITHQQLKTLCPNASASTLARNALPAEDSSLSRRVAGEKLGCDSSAGTPVRVDLVIRPTTDQEKLNKLERAWLYELQRMDYRDLKIQSMTLKLADDTRYTPDFTAIGPNGELIAWETKGFMRDDANVKIKVAARSFRWINFVLVRREKGQWQLKDIKP